MAMQGMACYSLHLERVEVEESAVVGQVDRGLQQLMTALNGERITAAAVTNGVARGAIEAATARARSRSAFGKPIGQFQAVQHRLAACAVQTELAWSAGARGGAPGCRRRHHRRAERPGQMGVVEGIACRDRRRHGR
jgi:alkylation response protein AidB-like acyl-CoA dehydrogenase